MEPLDPERALFLIDLRTTGRRRCLFGYLGLGLEASAWHSGLLLQRMPTVG